MSRLERPDDPLARRHANLARLSSDLFPVRQAILAAADISGDQALLPEQSAGNDELSALDILVRDFGFTEIDRLILLLLLGIQVDPVMSAAASVIADGGETPRLTVQMAIEILQLPEAPGTHLAFSELGTLRRNQFIRLDPGAAFLQSALLLDECTMTFLTELVYFDPALAPFMRPLRRVADLPESLRAPREALLWARRGAGPCHIWLNSPSRELAEQVFATALNHAPAAVFAASAIPAEVDEARILGVRLNRHKMILDAEIALEFDTPPNAFHAPAALAAFLREINTTLVCWAPTDTAGNPDHNGRETAALRVERPQITITIPDPTATDRETLWRDEIEGQLSGLLTPELMDGLRRAGQIDNLAAQMSEEYRLEPQAIAGAVRLMRLREDLPETQPATGDIGAIVNTGAMRLAAQAATHQRLSSLAEHIPALGSLDDLVLARREKAKLLAIRDHMANRRRVYREWKLDRVAGERGLGVSALFYGPSGTGKTFAGEKLAAELGLALFRVDLSQTVSKWIGETEKNISQVFEAAQGGGALLLFDEADALFGKRGDAKDSGGHHANATVGHLLQAMERHPGMMILTTNRFDAVDQAFLRRLNYVVDFPAPGVAERRLIWQRCLPETVPQRDIDFDLLAGLPLSGGQIRLVAVHAAIHAAARPGPVTMQDAAFAARMEYDKHGRTPSERLFQVIPQPVDRSS